MIDKYVTLSARVSVPGVVRPVKEDEVSHTLGSSSYLCYCVISR